MFPSRCGLVRYHTFFRSSRSQLLPNPEIGWPQAQLRPRTSGNQHRGENKLHRNLTSRYLTCDCLVFPTGVSLVIGIIVAICAKSAVSNKALLFEAKLRTPRPSSKPSSDMILSVMATVGGP